MNLIIDIGNTLVKYAVFNNDQLVEILKTSEIETGKVNTLIKEFDIKNVIISSVRKEMNWNLDVEVIHLSHKTSLPINLNYKTPETLGKDRIANIVAVSEEYPNKNAVVIDAGTCITYDFINKNKEYLGGRISPGLEMRYKSLNEFTELLPKLSVSGKSKFIGDDTDSSIFSGVEQGVLSEVDSLISVFRKENEDLIVVVTGGDTFFFENALKNSIFADQNLVLKGLNIILKYNEDK
ncbi:MAG: type III pantothenate kinase [Flavobacteriales bacterium]|nr:type III pantothenate kinase [Flavobacteriales bacterium]MBT5699193.1 type III pantothenate kinase [Flavobacteriales bacterium]MBT6698794.1 type III pantothenate kinase [Flavobacteriales bacterium]MBT6815287.1 type III pantothenate kinase [Flavobacteriales bacterium]MBT7727190.1 type III pantothenate kinase [Flavobacteriales bacterium]